MDQSTERHLTADTTPKEPKPEPFSDLFNPADYDDSNSPD